MKSNYKYLAFEVIARIWENLDLEANAQERKFPNDCSKHFPEKKCKNVYWDSWIHLGTEKYMISTPYKKEHYSDAEDSSCIYCRLWIWSVSSEEVECLPLSLPVCLWENDQKECLDSLLHI